MLLRCFKRLCREGKFLGIFSLVYLGGMLYLLAQQTSHTDEEVRYETEILNRIDERTALAISLRHGSDTIVLQDHDVNKTTADSRRRLPARPTDPNRASSNKNTTVDLPRPAMGQAPINITQSLSANLSRLDYNCNVISPPGFLPPGRLPLTALASFPGSGNTWARVLLSSLTGYNTGDIYRDGAFSKTPGFTFKKDDTVIAVKTHHPFWDDNNGPDSQAPAGRYWERAIILVRHPLDATVSVYNWHKTKGSHTKTAPLHAYFSKDGNLTRDWTIWAHNQIRNWGRCLHYWVNQFNRPILIVFYEDLITDLRRELVAINEFLGLPLQPERLHCTFLSNAQKKFKRDTQLDKRKLYDGSMLNEVEIVLKSVHVMLTTNYTHPVKSNRFSIPTSYRLAMVRENFSQKPV